MTPTAFIGIDPGLTGAIVVLHEVRAPCVLALNGEPDAPNIATWLKLCLGWSISTCCIEQVWRPNKLVYCAGILEGTIACQGIPVHRVAPVTWRKEIFGDIHYCKEDAIAFCMAYYPTINLMAAERSRIPNHNIAEATLIAHYAKLKWGNTNQ